MKDAANYVCPMIKVAKDDIEAMINRVKNIAVPASKYNTVSTAPKNLGRRQIARM